MVHLSPSRRLRRTPFSDGVEAAGVSAYTVYNHMLLPTVFRSLEEDYRHLKEAVQVWDVACERQVELRGPDAGRLMQWMTPRDLSGIQIGRCAYIPVVDACGGMLNDPVALKLAEDRWWISLADSDLLYWVAGLAHGLRLDVRVTEPDVSPLAVQGPLAEDLAARVFGETVRGIRFFHFHRLDFHGHPLVVARSGYSKQGCFEIYVEGSDLGMPLWTTLMEAGNDLDVRAGCPNGIERVEGGLLSYGNDMTAANSPFDCGLGRFCDAPGAIDHVGSKALDRIARDGPARQIRAIEIWGAPVPTCDRLWPLSVGGDRVGHVSSAAYSPDFATNVAIGMVDRAHWEPGTNLEVETSAGFRSATLRDRFWA